jgi:RNA polymerase primary sigma factor
MRQLKITKQVTNRETASLDKYLQEIGKVELITADEEVELAKKISAGDGAALEKLTKANLRFVVSVSKQYQNQGLSLPDLINEGNLGLIKAAQRFDETKGFKFISYAVWWIRQSILQSLNEHSRTIRIPVNVVQDLHKERKRIEKTGEELGSRFVNLPSVIHLETNINEDGDTLIDLIENKDSLRPDHSFYSDKQIKDGLMEILDILDSREKQIIMDYYGMSGTPRTLEDIGQDFNLTKERVRQIKERGLRKLRNESASLFDYL